MKKLSLLLIFFLCFQLYSQKDYEFGKVTPEELFMKVYDKDSTANAVVLYEQGDVEFFEGSTSFYTRTKVYTKIKILSKEGFDEGTVEFIIYNGRLKKERVVKIKGITHNGNTISELNEDAIYETELSENYKKISFALPNIKVGSVIEYSYVFETPFTFKFKGWDFQSYVPKVKSVFKAKIPPNFRYNRQLIGALTLSKNEAVIKKNCIAYLHMSGFFECEQLTYEMVDIPAFIEEDYMTAPSNFISRIEFELAHYERNDGENWKFTQNWNEVDNHFNNDDSIGGQLRRNSFFKKNIPADILNEKNYLTRAIKIFQFIQNHYSWNGNHNLSAKMSVRKAFGNKKGSVGEINLSLINALNVCGIEAELVLLSTRDNGTPSKVHPIITDFNYIIAKIEVDEKTIFLDASDKKMAFGMLPFKCLNGDARVMDFKYGSYWEKVKPYTQTKNKINMFLNLDNIGITTGKMRIVHYGYNAIEARKKLDSIKEDKYLLDFEDENDNLIINNYNQKNVENKEKPFTEEFEITIENDDTIGDKIILNPFFFS
ncbi:MAG: DUF3857 domain-containing protein, partial [Urechidicola sp.]|nr:DUF3857 domain-containing protein [Urechidicola sp.]